MNHEALDYENDFNLFQYFQTITLNQLKQENGLNKTALYYQNKKLSFNELNENIMKINNYLYDKLSNKLIDSNRIIGIHLNPDEFTIPVLLAIQSLSSSYLPIDPQLPNERMEYIIKDSNPLCIITNITNNSKLIKIIENNKNIELIDLNDIFSSDIKLNDVKMFKAFDKSDFSCVLYTSGSTGLPKGVCLEHFSIMNRLNWQWNTFEISSNETNNDIGAFKTSLNFVDHISEIFAFILKGLPIVVVDNETLTRVDKLVQLIFDYKITYFVLVPSLLRNMLLYIKSNNLTNRLSSIRRWVCSGEALSADLLDLFFDTLNDSNSILSNFYGSTEVTADVTYVSFESKKQFHSLLFENSNVPIGRPIGNSKIVLFDENMNEINVENKIGEIYACGFCLANGYLNDALNKSNKFFVINGIRYFKTGDFGFVHNNLLYFAGRNDSQLKIRGKRINLSELEYYSTKIDGIELFVPLIYDVDNENKIIIAYYKSNLKMDESKLNELITNSLKNFVFDYMMPSYIIKLDEIPLLYNGKIDKQLLKKLFLEKYLPSIQFNSKMDSITQNGEHNLVDELTSEIQNITGFELIKMMNNLKKEDYLNLKLNELGISSLNATIIYLSSEKINKNMKFEEFLSSGSLNDIIEKISNSSNSKTSSPKSQSPPPKSETEFIQNNNNNIDEQVEIFNDLKLNLDEMSQHLEVHPFSENNQYSTKVLKMMVETFTKKNVIHSLYPEYQDTLFEFYNPTAQLLKDSKESFIVYDKKKNKFVGGTYIYDYAIKPPIDIKNEYYLSFVELLGNNKRLVAEHIKSKLLNATFITTNTDATDLENIILVNFIEDQIIKIANYFDYDSIISVNTNKLTRDLAINFKGYNLEKEVQINKFKNSNGNAFFSKIPDTYKLAVCVKYLKNLE